jgi:hypothetical protein
MWRILPLTWISNLSDLKIRFRLQVKSYISNWRFSKSQHLARYVSRHNAMAYDTAAPSRWCKLSARGWSPVHRWTGPSRPVVRAAKAAMMMVAPVVAAKVGSCTGLVWTFPPPSQAVQRQQRWQTSEGRGDKEGDCNGNEGGEQ